MDKKNNFKSAILIVIVAVLVVAFYFRLSNKQEEKTEQTSVSAVQEVLLRDMDRDYPPSPKEVVKYYAEITKCFYDGDCSDEELEKLSERARFMYDEELNANKTKEKNLEDLKFDINDFANQSIKISSYSVSASTDVEYSTIDNRDCARLYCMFNLSKGSTMMSSYQEFLLRKDEAGHWKILGWNLAKDNNNE